MIMNFTSSYAIEPVDSAIRAISEAFNGVPYIGPALAIIVEMALRFGFAALETKCEWENLLSGKSVVVFKDDISEVECIKDLQGFLSVDTSNGKKDDSKLALTYEQYVLILLLFLTSYNDVNDRTRNLIELNVNAVLDTVGEDDNLDSDYNNLKFKMADTYTAVETTCYVQADFAIIPKGFAKSFLDSDNIGQSNGISYSDLENLEKTGYEYSVIRGY